MDESTRDVVARIRDVAPQGWRDPVFALDADDGILYAAYNQVQGGDPFAVSTLKAIDVRRRAIVWEAPGLRWASGIAFVPDDGRVYVASSHTGDVTLVDRGSGEVVGRIAGLEGPRELAYNPVDGNLYAASHLERLVNESGTWTRRFTSGVAIIDPRTRSVVGNLTGFDPEWSGPAYIRYDAHRNHLVVGNQTGITGIDATSHAVAYRISGLSFPGPLAVHPTDRHVYAGMGDGLVDLDPDTQEVRRIGYDYRFPFGVAVDPGSNRVFVANRGSTDVVVIDGSTDRIIGHLDGFGWPDSVTYNRRTNDLIVGNEENYTLSIVDLDTNQTRGIVGDVHPWAVRLDDGTGRLFVGTSAGLRVLDGGTYEVIADLTDHGSLEPMAVDPARGRIFARLRDPPYSLLALDTEDRSILWTVDPTVSWVTAAALHPSRDVLLAGHWPPGGIRVMNASTGETTDAIAGPWSVESVLFNPSNGYVYVADSGPVNQLWVLDGSTHEVLQRIELPGSPSRMAYSEANQKVYIALGRPLASNGLVFAVPSERYPPGSADFWWWAGVAILGVLVSATVLLLLRRRRAGRPPDES